MYSSIYCPEGHSPDEERAQLQPSALGQVLGLTACSGWRAQALLQEIVKPGGQCAGEEDANPEISEKRVIEGRTATITPTESARVRAALCSPAQRSARSWRQATRRTRSQAGAGRRTWRGMLRAEPRFVYRITRYNVRRSPPASTSRRRSSGCRRPRLVAPPHRGPRGPAGLSASQLISSSSSSARAKLRRARSAC